MVALVIAKMIKTKEVIIIKEINPSTNHLFVCFHFWARKDWPIPIPQS